MTCEVYWGSHGCQHVQGHAGAHECSCCDCVVHLGLDKDPESGCVAKPPYYGKSVTVFYGADAERLGLPTHDLDEDD